jgi:hypothetical protein
MATGERTRSAERNSADREMLGRITEVLDRLWQEPRPVRHTNQFKTPTYDGKSDVEYFIQQFNEVAMANEWQPPAALLHLREALKDGAKDCGRPATLAGIYTALRARFGLSPREARAKISVLKKDYKTTLQEHASEVERLISIAYEELPVQHRAGLTMSTFTSTLGNAYLQRHLLAVPTDTLEEAVRAGNEYLQIKVPNSNGAAIRAVEEEEEPDRIAQIQPETPTETMIKLLQKLTEKVERLENKRANPTTRDDSTKRTGCWGCGKEGHVRKRCPTNPWSTSPNRETTHQGNETGPQQ